MKSFLLIVGLVLSFLLIKINQEVKILRKQNDVLLIKYDSIVTENFINFTNSERYRIASEHLMQENQKCGIEFEVYLGKLE